MKPGSYIVNTSRGGIVNEKALIKYVTKNKFRGIALDVLEGESPFGVKESEMVKFSKTNKNIVITPHLGGSSYPYMNSIFKHSIKEIKRMLDKKFI